MTIYLIVVVAAMALFIVYLCKNNTGLERKIDLLETELADLKKAYARTNAVNSDYEEKIEFLENKISDTECAIWQSVSNSLK